MVTLIVAVANNNVIGRDNYLLWYLPADLNRFKRLTMGHHIIMGRKTFESIGKPLLGRQTVIITKDKNYRQDSCIVVHSTKQAIQIAKKKDPNPFIIGGGEIYKQSLPFVDKIELTRVLGEFEGNIFFPRIGKQWKETNKETHKADEQNKYDYEFITYIKKEA